MLKDLIKSLAWLVVLLCSGGVVAAPVEIVRAEFGIFDVSKPR